MYVKGKRRNMRKTRGRIEYREESKVYRTRRKGNGEEGQTRGGREEDKNDKKLDKA